MAELVVVTGRPMVHDLRAMLDGINYVTRYGIEWRALANRLCDGTESGVNHIRKTPAARGH